MDRDPKAMPPQEAVRLVVTGSRGETDHVVGA